MTRAFDDWKRRAEQCELLTTAAMYGAVLKRGGREYAGPCPYCGGRDRFSINPSKNLWHCRGHGGGHGAIGMVMHIAGLSFLAACEALTGEPSPSGQQAKPLSEAERAERNRRRQESEARQRAREAEERAYQEDTREAAQAIWRASAPSAQTLAQQYLVARGLPEFESDVIRFHRSLPYPNGKRYPALVARVDDMAGNLTAIWRIFLCEDGRKADVENAKLGLGPAGGGAVRIGGIDEKIGVAEGVETALAAWHLVNKTFPVWAALSTSGMKAIELPLAVQRVVIFPDGDKPLRKRGHQYEPAEPAGRKAADVLRSRLVAAGIACTIAAEPSPGRDYLDIWNDHCRETA
jgi:putative DNA primase/helicase